MRTVPVQIVCHGCGRPYRTTVRASSTRCPRCHRQRYVRRDQSWEGPVGQLGDAAERAAEANRREPVELACPACRYRWTSRAAPGNTVRCPACRHNRRVPSSPPPAPVRAPRPVRAPEPPRRRAAVQPTRQAAPRRAAPAPTRRPGPSTHPAPVSGGLAAMLGSLLSGLRTPPAPAPPPRPASPPPAPLVPPRRTAARLTPTRVPDPSPHDLRQRTNPDVLASRLRVLGVPLAAPATWRAGCCWIADRNARACGLNRSHVGTFLPGAHVELCQTHAEIISRRSAETGLPVSVVLA